VADCGKLSRLNSLAFGPAPLHSALGGEDAQMMRYIRRYLAVRSYARRLSQDLARRFGKREFYTVEQVTQAAQRGKFSDEFIAYAHATFCSQADFDAHYQPLEDVCNYQALRRTVGKRYLYGQLEFDATTIIRRFRADDRGDFYESRLGEDYPSLRA